jgi:hypothetical protein
LRRRIPFLPCWATGPSPTPPRLLFLRVVSLVVYTLFEMKGNLEAYKTFYPPPDPDLLRQAGLVRPAPPIRFYGRTSPIAWPNRHLEEEVIPLVIELTEEDIGISFAEIFRRPEDYEAFRRALREIAERSIPFYTTLRFYDPDENEKVRVPNPVTAEASVYRHLQLLAALYHHFKRGAPYPLEPEALYPSVEATLRGIQALEDLPAPRRFARFYLHGEAHLRVALPRSEGGRPFSGVDPQLHEQAFAPPPDLRQGGYWGYVLYKGVLGQAKLIYREENLDLSPERDLYFPYSEIEARLARMAEEGLGAPRYGSLAEEREAYEELLSKAEDIYLEHVLSGSLFLQYAGQGLKAMAEDFARDGYLEIPPEIPIGHIAPIYMPDDSWGGTLLRYVGRWEREDGVPIEVYDPALDFGLALVREKEHLGEVLSLYTFSRMERGLPGYPPSAKLSTDHAVVYAFRHTDLPYGYTAFTSALFFGPGKGWKENFHDYYMGTLADSKLGVTHYQRFARPATVELWYAQAFVDRVAAAYGGALLRISGAENASFLPVGPTGNSVQEVDWHSLLVDSVRLEEGRLVVEARTAGAQITRNRGDAPLPEPLAVVRREAGDDFPFHSFPRPLPGVEVRVYGDAIDRYLVEWAKERNPERYYGMVLPASLITSHTVTWESAANTTFARPLLRAPSDSIAIDYYPRYRAYAQHSHNAVGLWVLVPYDYADYKLSYWPLRSSAREYASYLEALVQKEAEKVPEAYRDHFLYGCYAQLAIRLANVTFPAHPYAPDVKEVAEAFMQAARDLRKKLLEEGKSLPYPDTYAVQMERAEKIYIEPFDEAWADYVRRGCPGRPECPERKREALEFGL